MEGQTGPESAHGSDFGMEPAPERPQGSWWGDWELKVGTVVTVPHQGRGSSQGLRQWGHRAHLGGEAALQAWLTC